MRFKPVRCLIFAICISIFMYIIMVVVMYNKNYEIEKEIPFAAFSDTKNEDMFKVFHKPSKSVLKLSSDECSVKSHQFFPLCEEKFQYLNRKDLPPCFSKVHGINGTKCSIYNYLQKVEPFCPDYKEKQSEVDYAVPRFNLDGLLEILPVKQYRWMHERAIQTWNEWVLAIQQFILTKQKWQKKKVLCFMGSMGFQPMILEWAGKGGPLGELVQWTDLISGLYVLGYDIKIHLNSSEFPEFMDSDDSNGCAQSKFKENLVDIIYTDSNGFIMTMNQLGFASSAKYRCMMRILDSFGTYPEFNYPSYPHKIPGGRSGWANENLIPTQFLTLFPHTHDNSFLGFVVGSINSTKDVQRKPKKNMALIYAKLASYLAGRITYLNIISEYFEIHATLVDNFPIPSYVINHGPISGHKVKELLVQSKLFIGVGFPYEGPGPLEALAAGAAYIQPKFDEPRNKFNDKFFEGKPTLRKLGSQAPYMEEMVGEPYSYTIDVNNELLLRQTLKKIKDREDLPPKIPKEFSSYGMLERIHIFTEHMNFCDATAPRWPPIDHLKIYVAERGQSCKDACLKRGLVCERTFFVDIDTKESIERNANLQCSKVKNQYVLHAPSFDPITKDCFLQSHGQLYSCMHEEINLKRLCPCRDFEIEQMQLCENCL